MELYFIVISLYIFKGGWHGYPCYGKEEGDRDFRVLPEWVYTVGHFVRPKPKLDLLFRAAFTFQSETGGTGTNSSSQTWNDEQNVCVRSAFRDGIRYNRYIPLERKCTREDASVGGNVKKSMWLRLYNVAAHGHVPECLGHIFSPREYQISPDHPRNAIFTFILNQPDSRQYIKYANLRTVTKRWLKDGISQFYASDRFCSPPFCNAGPFPEKGKMEQCRKHCSSPLSTRIRANMLKEQCVKSQGVATKILRIAHLSQMEAWVLYILMLFYLAGNELYIKPREAILQEW